MSSRDRLQKKLWKLLQKGSLEDLKEFLDELASDDIVALLEKRHKASGDSPMHIACRHGFTLLVKYLHETWNIGLQLRNLDDKTPLHEAAAAGWPDVCRYLLGEGVDINALKRSDWTPLMLACTRKSNLPVIKLLVDGGADMDLVNKDGWNCFHIACREGAVMIIRYLLKLAPGLWRTVSNNGRTPLHTATMHGRKEALVFLIENCGFSLNVKDSCGSTPLMEAVKGGHMQLAKLLVGSGADVNFVDNLGRSVIHVAAEGNRTDAIKYLVKDCHMDVNARTAPCTSTKSGHTAIDWALKENQMDAVAVLKALGANDGFRQ